MRRLLSLICAAAVSSLAAVHAQEVSHRPELSFGMSGVPVVGGRLLHYNGSSYWGCCPDPSLDLDNMYGRRVGDTRTAGAAALCVDIPVKRWLSVPFTFTTSLNFTPVEDPFDGTSHTFCDAAINILAGVRFKYMNREHVNLYSAIHAGLGMCNVGEFCDAEFFPAIQLVPIGVRAGGRVYGFAEIGAGTLYFGGQIGVGYKF